MSLSFCFHLFVIFAGILEVVLFYMILLCQTLNCSKMARYAPYKLLIIWNSFYCASRYLNCSMRRKTLLLGVWSKPLNLSFYKGFLSPDEPANHPLFTVMPMPFL